MLISRPQLLDALQIADAKLDADILRFVDDAGEFIFLPEPDYQGN